MHFMGKPGHFLQIYRENWPIFAFFIDKTPFAKASFYDSPVV